MIYRSELRLQEWFMANTAFSFMTFIDFDLRIVLQP
jgi:hypothetical protein